MKKYCDKCKKLVETKIVNKTEEYEVFNEKIKVNSDVLVCSECLESIFDEELDKKTLNKVYDIYKKKNNLLSAKEIIEIREKYGLSQRSLASLLGWGEKTIFRYENGSIQDKSHNYILEQLKDEKNMINYLNKNRESINTKIYNKVLNSIELNNKKEDFNFEDRYNYEPSIYSGYKRFDIDKTCAMIGFFVQKSEKLQITKLLKLLNYSDMLFFKQNTISISGLRYKHYTYGPIPEDYELILYYMTSNDMLEQSFESDNNYEYHYYKDGKNNRIDILNTDEIKTLETVFNKFKDYGSRQISEYSHLEKGYQETKNNEYISYEYASDTNI